MPNDQVQPRQLPVSCESCRKKKLKCNREHSCSNCLARGVTCIYAGRKASVPSPTSPASGEEISRLRAENAGIHARLEKLEEAMLTGGSSLQFETEERPSKVRRLPTQDTSIPSPATTLSIHDSAAEKDYRNDFRWLEGVGTQENSRLPNLSDPFFVRVGSLEQIFQHISDESRQERSILLPIEEQGMHLFDCYTDALESLQHLIHVPTVRRSIRRLYHRLHLGERIEPTQTVLLMSLLTSIATYWGLAENTTSIFGSTHKALTVATQWLKTALDIHEHIRRSASATLETVQGKVILVFLIYHIEGFSPKIRAMQASTISMAKDLGLHKIDNQPIAEQQSQFDVIDRELRRRIWWHIASTDWSLSLIGGPHEATYSINPRHMKVKLPRNITDDELENQPPDFDHPDSYPTEMAYYIQRIRLAEICRNIADLAWDLELDNIAIENIIQIDDQFESLLSGLPDFLKVDPEMRARFKDFDQTNHYIVMQRYIVNIMIAARRCKFHLAFLLRASNDPDYAFSRNACLRSARVILQLRQQLQSKDSALWIANLRLCGVLHIYFYATMVLVMDFCVNRSADDEISRKEEIQDAFKTLEEAKRLSSAAGMFLDSLLMILRKHKIRLQNQEQMGEFSDGDTVPISASSDALASGHSNPCNNHFGDDVDQMVANLDFDEMWKSYINLESTMDPQNWDALINDLDNCISG